MTSSASVATRRVGVQRPTHLLTPEGRFDFTDGDVACDLAASLGLELYDWQRWAVRWILALDENGDPAVNTAIINMPRQNGKGAVLEALELFWLIVARVPIVIHTAHEADTSAGHMDRIEGLTAEPSIEIPNMKTYRSNGKEKTRNLDDKLLLDYRTRTKATKRGASPQRVVLDEAQELEDAHLAALVPAMAAQSMDPDKLPQLIYTGSAALEHSVYWRSLIDKVLTNRPAKTFLAMWASDPDVDASDVDEWYRVNPLLGLRISESWVRDTEYLVMSSEDFATERLGVSRALDVGKVGPIPLDTWASLTDANSMPDPKKSRLALDTNPERTWFTLCLAGERPDGLIHVEITKSHPQLAEAVELAASAAGKLGVSVIVSDQSGLADSLIAAGCKVDVMKSGEFAASTSKLIDATRGEAPRLRHRDEPAMRKALEMAQTKPYGDGGVVWSRRTTSGDISPLTAVTMAYGRLTSGTTTELPPLGVVYA